MSPWLRQWQSSRTLGLWRKVKLPNHSTSSSSTSSASWSSQRRTSYPSSKSRLSAEMPQYSWVFQPCSLCRPCLRRLPLQPNLSGIAYAYDSRKASRVRTTGVLLRAHSNPYKELRPWSKRYACKCSSSTLTNQRRCSLRQTLSSI